MPGDDASAGYEERAGAGGGHGTQEHRRQHH